MDIKKIGSCGGSKNEIKNPMLVVTDIDKSIEFYKRFWTSCHYGFWSK